MSTWSRPPPGERFTLYRLVDKDRSQSSSSDMGRRGRTECGCSHGCGEGPLKAGSGADRARTRGGISVPLWGGRKSPPRRPPTLRKCGPLRSKRRPHHEPSLSPGSCNQRSRRPGPRSRKSSLHPPRERPPAHCHPPGSEVDFPGSFPSSDLQHCMLLIGDFSSHTGLWKLMLEVHLGFLDTTWPPPPRDPCRVLNLRTTLQKGAAVPRRARIEDSWTCVALNSGLESNEEEEEDHCRAQPAMFGFPLHVYLVPWSEFPIVPSYPHYPHHPCPTLPRNKPVNQLSGFSLGSAHGSSHCLFAGDHAPSNPKP